MKSPTAIKRQTVTSSVLDLLRDRIISGIYPGGYQIRQEALADEFSVSRIPIREALLQLEADGLVVIHTHKGAVVASLTPEDAIDIFDARLTLEPFVLGKAIENADDADTDRVRAALQNYEVALNTGAPPERLSQLNWAFHNALSAPADRPRTFAVLATLHNSADRYLRLQIDTEAAQAKALEDHRLLAEAFANRSIALAQKLLRKHISDARDDVIKNLKGRAVAR